MINLVTGYRGKAHVTADEEATRNLMIFNDFYVTTNGDQLAYNLVSNNQLRILSGDLLVQGRFVRVENYEDVTIETGTQEMFRTDLICLRYEKDNNTGVESMALVAVKGTESSTSAEVPTYNEGIIAEGDNIVDFPLYKVELEGINITAVTALFTPTEHFTEQFEKKSSYAKTIMFASSWAGNTYSFEKDFPAAECHIYIQPDGDLITTEQMEALGAAQLAGSSTSNVYTAKGEVPTVDIPIIIRKVVK